jgi:hypothetical protein
VTLSTIATGAPVVNRLGDGSRDGLEMQERAAKEAVRVGGRPK